LLLFPKRINQRRLINMKQQRRITLAVACACASLAAGQASAFEVANKDGWKLDVNGTVNAFYVNSDQEITTGGGVTTENKQANVQNGLLPGWINFVVTTQQEGYDIKAHFGLAPGINSNSSIVGLPSSVVGNGATADADAYSKIDSRQVYFQFGNTSMGTLKFGRDIGLFGQNPILNDMTLLGVGGTARAAEPFNTSFGMIGHGYMYTGFQPQITYSAPAMGGFNASAGIFNPTQYAGTERKSPGIQALVTYDWKGSVNGKAWGSYVNHKTSGPGKAAVASDITTTPITLGSNATADGFKATGFEGGVKVGLGAVELLASGFSTKGLGISTVGAQFLGGLDASNKPLKSEGIFVQGTVKATNKLKVGLSYGENTDKDLAALGTETFNKAVAAGAYYSLTPSVTLVGELVNEKAGLDGAVAPETKTQTLSLGAKPPADASAFPGVFLPAPSAKDRRRYGPPPATLPPTRRSIHPTPFQSPSGISAKAPGAMLPPPNPETPATNCKSLTA
jgi:predicted porin